MLSENCMRLFTQILSEELVPATGCTEPIAIAYAAAKVREVLACLPTRVEISVSGNILKNVKSVVVPNTNGLTGIRAAAAAGIIAGDAQRGLEVIANVDKSAQKQIRAYLNEAEFCVSCAEAPLIFDIVIDAYSGNNKARVRIANHHSNIVHISRNDEIIFDAPAVQAPDDNMCDRSTLCVKDIVEYANSVDLADVKHILDRQIACNMAIAEEGMTNSYGANVGKVLRIEYGDEPRNLARAYAAAASDARMSGCEMPVVIISGSGNQGITASIPVIAYARATNKNIEKLYRALIVSSLVTVQQKTCIGRLSAFCGAVSAGGGAGAGIAYLEDGDYTTIAHTIVNALAIVSGMVCDGAKASCAAKIASAVDAGILGYRMYAHNQEFRDGDGIVKKGVDRTIAQVGVLARDGMRETDKEILRIMLEE